MAGEEWKARKVYMRDWWRKPNKGQREIFPLKYAAEGAPKLYRSAHKVTKSSSPHGVKRKGSRALKDTDEALITCI
jgi:hypothetical protein